MSQQNENEQENDEFYVVDDDEQNENENDFIDEASLDDEDSFDAEFSEGYTFKSLIEYLRFPNPRGNFKFSANMIRYNKMDSRKKMFNNVEIDCDKIEKYEFDSKHEEIVIGINMVDLRTITKPVKKKEGIKIIKCRKDPKLYIHIISRNNSSSKANNFGSICSHDEEDADYTVEEYTRSEKTPNFAVSAADFVSVCTRMSQIKCNDITIRSQHKGAILETSTEGGTVNKTETLGEPYQRVNTSPSGSPTYNSSKNSRLLVKNAETSLRVKTATIKILSKLGNLSTGGMLKVFMEPGKPMKIITPIGNYGFLRTYIFDEDNH
jgi:hypothetical protein